MDLWENSVQDFRQRGQRWLPGEAGLMRSREDPQMIRRQRGIWDERYKPGVLGDDAARLITLLRNEGTGKALAAIGKEPTSSFDPFDDLAWNDRDVDDR